MKKGFTLLELLAVIIVIAVIALIVVPMLFNIIKDMKKSSFGSSVNGIIDAITYKQLEAQVSGSSLVKEYSFPTTELKLKGSQPTGGIAKVDARGRIQIAVYDGDWCAIKDYTESKVTVVEYVAGQCIVGSGN